MIGGIVHDVSQTNPWAVGRRRRQNALSSADPRVAARHVIGRLLDLSHLS